MTEFEANAEPLQGWLNSTEVRVQESSARLHDLSAKKQELSKLQVLWSSCPLTRFYSLCGLKTAGSSHQKSVEFCQKAKTQTQFQREAIGCFAFDDSVFYFSIFSLHPLSNNMLNCKSNSTSRRTVLPFES